MEPSSETAVFRALADTTRRSILEKLMRDGEQRVMVLTRHAGVSQPAVSKHLGLLKHAGLVTERRDGRSTYYRAEAQGLAPLMDWMGLHDAFWRERFDRLEALLKKIER